VAGVERRIKAVRRQTKQAEKRAVKMAKKAERKLKGGDASVDGR
jgi:hypothetical protein